jgi:hypothetical protein
VEFSFGEEKKSECLLKNIECQTFSFKGRGILTNFFLMILKVGKHTTNKVFKRLPIFLLIKATHFSVNRIKFNQVAY